MYRKDQVKGIVAIILFGIIGISFFIFGEESDVTRYVAIIACAMWLVSMYFINKKFEKKD